MSQFKWVIAFWPAGMFAAGLVAVVVGVALAVSVPVALIVLGVALAATAIQEVYF